MANPTRHIAFSWEMGYATSNLASRTLPILMEGRDLIAGWDRHS